MGRQPPEPSLQRLPGSIDRRSELHLVRRTSSQQRTGLGPPDDIRPNSPQLLGGLRQPMPGQPTCDSLDRMVDHVGQLLPLVDRPAVVDVPGAQHDQYEHDVHDRRGRLVEVVVVGGDELADLVDEQPEADATHQRGRRADHRADVREQQVDRQQHQQTTRQDVRDVQALAADLRVAAQPEDQTGDQDGRDTRHHERGQVLPGPDIADQPSPEQVRRPVHFTSAAITTIATSAASTTEVTSRRVRGSTGSG
jgi:hypothetical protein